MSKDERKMRAKVAGPVAGALGVRQVSAAYGPVTPFSGEAADLIENHGYHIRMGNHPDYPSLIEPAKVWIIRT